MVVKKLQRTKLGVLVTYKSFFITKKREAIWIKKYGRWGWADEDLHGHTWIDTLLTRFEESNEKEYVLNGA